MDEDALKQELMTLIGNNVRRCRMERGLTQEELANRVDVTPSTIARIEGGSRMMSILNLHAVASVLDVSYDSLLRGCDADARIRNISVKLSGQTPDNLAHLERIIQTVIEEYGAPDAPPAK